MANGCTMQVLDGINLIGEMIKEIPHKLLHQRITTIIITVGCMVGPWQKHPHIFNSKEGSKWMHMLVIIEIKAIRDVNQYFPLNMYWLK